MTRRSDSLTLLMALVFSILIGYLDLRSDDMFVLIGLMAGCAFVLGLVQPRAVWRWGLVVGMGIPAAEVTAAVTHSSAPFAPPALQLTGTLMIFVFTASISLAAAYAGAFVRRFALVIDR